MKVLFCYYYLPKAVVTLKSLGSSALEYLEQCFLTSVPLSLMTTRVTKQLCYA